MTVTDFATGVLSVYFLYRGTTRGFINSLLFPFSIIAATVLSAVYFKMTNNMIISLLIGLVGPFILCFLLKFILKLWLQAINCDIKQPGFISRIAGAALTLVWGWVFIVLVLILFAVMPTWGYNLSAVHNDVIRSASYQIVARPVKEIFFDGPRQNAAAAINGPSANDDAKTLAQDPRFQKVMQDPEIQNEIDRHDLAKLMSNPKMMSLVQQIMNDPDTMKKVLALYKSQAHAQPPLPDEASKNQ